MTWTPDAAYVIHLSRRLDRLPTVQDMQRHVPALVVLDGVDGLGYPQRGAWKGSAGAWGNRESHCAVLTLAGDVRTVLVLEDDALIRAPFLDQLEGLVRRMPADWEAVMLGGEHTRMPQLVEDGRGNGLGTLGVPSIVRCTRTIRTHAYLLRGEAVILALQAASLAVQHWDHALATLLGERGRTYAPDPFLVPVAPSKSDIPDSVPLRTHYRYF